MAVYQGARQRSIASSSAGVAARQGRTAAPDHGSGNKRIRPMGLLMAVTVGATMLGLVYLTQTLGTNATSTEIWHLERKAAELWSDTRTFQILALKATEADEIVPKAKKQKLKRLRGPVILPEP